jgi:hypothetical protein
MGSPKALGGTKRLEKIARLKPFKIPFRNVDKFAEIGIALAANPMPDEFNK